MGIHRATEYISTLLEEPLTREILLLAHQTLLGYIPIKAGKLRQIYVHVGNFIPIHADEVRFLLIIIIRCSLF
jgi:hypothetical protein